MFGEFMYPCGSSISDASLSGVTLALHSTL